MQPAALPAPDNPDTWDDLKQPNTPHYPRLPFPAARSSGSRPATSRPPPAPPLAAGLRPGPCPARPLATDMAAIREQETPVTHAQQSRSTRKTPARATLDTTPLLQGGIATGAEVMDKIF